MNENKIDGLTKVLSEQSLEQRNYAIEIKEHLSKTVIVKANSLDEALKFVKDDIDKSLESGEGNINLNRRDLSYYEVDPATWIVGDEGQVFTSNGIIPVETNVYRYELYNCSESMKGDIS